MNTTINHKLDRLLIVKDIPVPVSPTIADIVMWLWDKHGIWIAVYKYKDHAADVCDDYVFRSSATGIKEFDSPIAAYEAAIEYVLNNLIKGGNK